MVQVHPIMFQAGNVKKASNSLNYADSRISMSAKKDEFSRQNSGGQISFTGSNANQVAHFVPEGPGFFKGGGVGDVILDWAKKLPNFDPSKEHHFFVPFYNADWYMDKDKNLVAKPVRFDNKDYLVSDTRDITKMNGNVNKFPVSELLTDTIETVDPVGKTVSKNVGLYQLDSSQLGLSDNVKVYATLTPDTGSMAQQYGYSYKDGSVFKHYSENSRSTVKLMDGLHKKTAGAFDPQHIMFHDYHGTAGMKFIQDEAANGNQLFKNINIGYEIHNGGRGYQGLGATPYEFFTSYATPQQVKQLTESQEYVDAVKMMPVDNGKSLEALVKKVMPYMVDDTGTLNPSMGPINLATTHNLPNLPDIDKKYQAVAKIATVSKPYKAELSELSEMSEGLTKGLNQASKEGRFVGIHNGSPALDEKSLIPESLFNPHQKDKIQMFFNDGKPVEYFQTFDPQAIKTVQDVENLVTPVKQANKLRFIERALRMGDIVPPEAIKGWDPSLAITSAIGRPTAKIYSNLDENTLKTFTQNPDTILFDSWGRGDFQKGIDELLMGFKKYIHSEGADKSSVLAVSGGLGNDDESKRVKALVDELLGDKAAKGRFLYIDGWCAPKAMSNASDYSGFTSRYEPCGLTIPMAEAEGSIPMATKTGGQAVAISAGENANGFSTDKSYFRVSHNDILESPYGEKFKPAYEKLIQAHKDKLSDDGLKAARLGQKAAELKNEQVIAAVESSDAYKALVRQYRDEIMSDDVCELFKKAANQKPEEKSEMILRSIIKNKDWHNNDVLNGGEGSSFKLIDEYFWKGAVPGDPSKAKPIIHQAELDKLTVFKGKIDDLVQGGVQAVGEAVKDAKNELKAIPETITGAGEKAVQAAGETVEEVKNDLKSAPEAITEAGKKAAEGMGEKLLKTLKDNKVGIAIAAVATATVGAFVYFTSKTKNAKKPTDFSSAQIPVASPVASAPAVQAVTPPAQLQEVNSNLDNFLTKSRMV